MTDKTNDNPFKTGPALILHSSEENDKPRAAYFSEDQATAATKLAGKMGFGLIRLTTPEQVEVARLLEAGKVFVSGKGAVPHVSVELYAKVEALVGFQASPERQSASPAAETSATSNDGTGLPTTAERQMPILGFATSWTNLSVGQLVIAQESLDDGWWEAVVVKRDEDLVTLRWRDYPQFPSLCVIGQRSL